MEKRLRRIIVGVVLFSLASIIGPYSQWLRLVLYLSSYIIVGRNVIFKAFRNIFRGKVFDENFLMTVATLGAMVIAEYPEAVAVMLFYEIGELFQSYAVNKSRRSIAELMNIRPDYANVLRGDELVTVDPDEVVVGDVIVIKPGEKVPLDGEVIEGNSTLDTSALTGESLPKAVALGSQVLSGCVNLNGVITVRVTKEYDESTVNKILDLVENASSKKSQSERFITRFAKYYTPVVVTMAVFLGVIPPLVIPSAAFGDWIYRALAFLVVSCPCALVISIPLSFFGGIGGASKHGVLVKGGNYLEALAEAEIFVFDKTGTLTKGVFDVQEVHPRNISQEVLLELAAHAESFSNHPISDSLRKSYGKEIDNGRVSNVEEIPGHGVIALVDGREVAAGNGKLMQRLNVPYMGETVGTVVHVAIDNEYAGYIVISDEVKEDSAQTIRELKEANVKQMVMLTGDAQNVAEKVAEALGMDRVYAELLPGDKVAKVEELLAQKSPKGKLAFVGDGLNDAPVLALADIGIAMGGLGSDAAIEAADIVIMNDEPSKIITSMKISQKTLRIATQNIVFAIGVKIIVLALSGLGITSMWAAIFADVGVTILAILNSFRTLNVQEL